MRSSTAVLLFVLVACGGAGGDAETTPEASESSSGSIVHFDESTPVYENGATSRTPSTETAEAPGEPSPTTSMQAPLETCGPGASYQAVSEWRCADGSMPLAGDSARGRDARVGSSGAHIPPVSAMESHIVDIYRVPCPEGDIEVFVCMFHC
jgi:hypothetical protein